MSLYTCTCMYVCMHVCMYYDVCCICVYVCMYVCTTIYAAYMYVCIHTHTHIYQCMYVCMYVYACVPCMCQCMCDLYVYLVVLPNPRLEASEARFFVLSCTTNEKRKRLWVLPFLPPSRLFTHTCMCVIHACDLSFLPSIVLACFPPVVSGCLDFFPAKPTRSPVAYRRWKWIAWMWAKPRKLFLISWAVWAGWAT